MRRIGQKLRLTGIVLARFGVAAALATAIPFAANTAQSAPVAQPTKKVAPKLKTPPKGTRLNVVTDKLSYDAKTQVAVATGKVVITYGNYVLVATKVVYDRKNDRMRATGKVHLREPGGNILTADIAQLQNRFRDGFARHLRLLLTNDATLTADYARRTDGNLTVYQRVTYTRCKTCLLPDGSPLWQIRSLKVTHNEEEGIIYHEDATFQFLGASIFWLPKLSHPDPTVKRRTGFLIPEFNYSSTYGFGVGTPYFINLAPNYDVTLRPFLTTKQGLLARATWRQRLAKGEYDLDVAGIYQLSKKVPPPGDTRFRGYARSIGKFEINKRWNWGWDATVVSDDTFARRYDINNRDDIISQVYLTGVNDRNFFSAELLHFRGLLATDNNRTFPYAAPYLRYNVTLDRPIFGGQLDFYTNMYSVRRRDPLTLSPTTANQATDQTRATFEANWTRRIVTSAGAVVTPFAKLRSDVFVTDNLPGTTAKDKVTTRFLPTAGFDVRWPFVASGSYGQQVLTPVVQFLTSPSENKTDQLSNEDSVSLNFDYSNLFLQNRFTGQDRFEGGTRVNVGVMSNWLFNDGGFLRFSAGQAIHLAGRNSYTFGSGLGGNYSDFVMAMAYQPNENLQLSYQARFDDRSFKVKTQEAGVRGRYGPLSGSINYLNVAAAPAYGRPLRQEQIWGDAEYFMTDRWAIFGSARYDLNLDRSFQNTVGVAYYCDCFDFKVYYKESNASDRDANASRSVMLSIDFKTLGSGKVGAGL
ncbi:LPS-assembly protein LptD @ Organic solvent tolerance protein precursor [hydrothermal vent metagenome]|uniref:LPS-assembly protein LptD @ Organic solvent tolerance protein n=1 Tax=hydrothermal vent metagenome TaxID=652676 RepID=A0A3B0S5W0_9ZZZZ